MSAEAELEALIERSARGAEFPFPWDSFVTLYPKKAAECNARWGEAPEGVTIKDGAIEAWPDTMGTAQVRSIFDPSQVQASIDGTPIAPVTEAVHGVDLKHHPVCPKFADNGGKHCACAALEKRDERIAWEFETGKVVQMVIDPQGELIVLTSRGEMFRQVMTGNDSWTWTPIPVPTADNTPPLEEEKQDGKAGT